MKKLLLISKSGETIPFMIIRCDSYSDHEWGFYVYREGERHIIHTEWDYFNEIDVNPVKDRALNLFEELKNLAY
jgi:hypothetical protein